MKCLRCGYCCKNLSVIIVIDPELGPVEGNLEHHAGHDKPCRHLKGDKPGEFSCGIHDREWYDETPCFAHGQFEKSPEDECRMGRHILDKLS